jgi:menaquinone-dependent protoporphyrinogen IX oxidase
MRILVTAASKHGSTREIGDAIGAELADRGLEVTVETVEEVGTIDGYCAVVLGSAIFMGQWMKAAKEFMARESSALASVPCGSSRAVRSGAMVAPRRTTLPTVGRATRSRRRSAPATTSCSRASSTGPG